MKVYAALLVCFIVSTTAQDVVQVVCSQGSITAKIQKKVVRTAGYEMANVHLNDKSCQFDEEDEDFFVKKIAPLQACGTHTVANDTHVQFTNSLSTVDDTGPGYPYGIVVGSKLNPKVLSALISCTYKIDLRVSTMYTPNITIIPIKIPDAFGAGEFRAAMAIYTDRTYATPYSSPPQMSPDDTVFVGITLMEVNSPEVHLLVEACWGTTSDDPTSTPKYPLIEDGCAIKKAANGGVHVAQNGNGHQALWNSPVFKFVGDGEAFDNVWLHCDLQICINRACAPTCTSRKRRALGEPGSFWGPEHFQEQHVITMGPITRYRITEFSKNETKTTYVDVDSGSYVSVNNNNGNNRDIWNPSIVTVLGVLGGLALVCLILALVVVIVRMRNRPEIAGLNLGSGATNKGFTA